MTFSEMAGADAGMFSVPLVFILVKKKFWECFWVSASYLIYLIGSGLFAILAFLLTCPLYEYLFSEPGSSNWKAPPPWNWFPYAVTQGIWTIAFLYLMWDMFKPMKDTSSSGETADPSEVVPNWRDVSLPLGLTVMFSIAETFALFVIIAGGVAIVPTVITIASLLC